MLLEEDNPGRRSSSMASSSVDDYVKRSPGTFHWHSGRIPILFLGCCIFALLPVIESAARGPGRTSYSNDQHQRPVGVWPSSGEVQVLSGSVRDGIRSQSISYAEPSGGSERFPRQLDTVHDDDAHLPMMWPDEDQDQEHWPANKKRFDSDYDRFIKSVEKAFSSLRRHHALDDAKANRLGWIAAGGDIDQPVDVLEADRRAQEGRKIEVRTHGFHPFKAMA